METKSIELGTLFVMTPNKFEDNFLKKTKNKKIYYDGWVCILVEKASSIGHPFLNKLYCFNDNSYRYITEQHLYENGGIFKPYEK